MFIKLKWCENPETESDYVYINLNCIVSICQDGNGAIIKTIRTGDDEPFIYVANNVQEIMEMIEKTKC